MALFFSISSLNVNPCLDIKSFHFFILKNFPQVLESYERAYSNMVRIQQLSELEEVSS